MLCHERMNDFCTNHCLLQLTVPDLILECLNPEYFTASLGGTALAHCMINFNGTYTHCVGVCCVFVGVSDAHFLSTR